MLDVGQDFDKLEVDGSGTSGDMCYCEMDRGNTKRVQGPCHAGASDTELQHSDTHSVCGERHFASSMLIDMLSALVQVSLSS